MKTHQLFSLSFALGVLFAPVVSGQTVDLDYGSGLDSGTSTIVRFGDSAGNGFSQSNSGYISAGYFADESAFTSKRNEFDTAAISSLDFASWVFDNFTEVAGSNFDSITTANVGYLTVSGDYDGTSGGMVGKVPYHLTFKGLDWATRASFDKDVHEVGLFSDSGAGTYSAFDAASPTNIFGMRSLTYDSVILGTPDVVDISASFAPGWSGNYYNTQAVVPEPSTYAMMLGAAAFGFVYYKRRIKGKKTEEEAKKEEA